MRASIDESLAALPIVTWVLENHDVTRIVTRFGEREARAAALLLLALPGPVFLYQGQELGLEEVDLPDELRQDPVFRAHGRRAEGPRRLPRAAAVDARRCRSARGCRSRRSWAATSVAAQLDDPRSIALALPPRARAAARRRVRVARELRRARSSSSATGSSAPST